MTDHADERTLAELDRACPTQAAGLLAHAVADEIVLYDAQQEMAFSLNTSARAVWERCDGHRTVAQICVELQQVLGVADEALCADVRSVVLELEQLHLLRLAPPSPAAS